MKDRPGGGYVVETGGSAVSGKVEATGDWYEYKTFPLGSIELPRKGAQTIEIHPQSEVPADLMYFKAIELRPRP